MITAERHAIIAAAFPFLQRADDAMASEFRRTAVPARLPEGRQVFTDGDVAEALPLVVEGVIRVYMVGRTGRELTLYRFGAGQTCILSANAILARRPLPAAAVVEQAVDAVLVPAVALRKWVHGHGLWRDFVFDLLARRLVDVLSVVDEVVSRRMDARVASLLLERARQQNPIVITHQEIAAELGTSREVVSRIVEGIAGTGLVRAARGRIEVLDLTSLESFATA